jgi:hypothetical protein
MSKAAGIYNMEMHEITAAGEFEITRVPGGWIYDHREYRTYVNPNGGSEVYHDHSPVFVPYGDQAKEERLMGVLRT